MTSGGRPRGTYGDVYPPNDQGMVGGAFSGNDGSCTRLPNCGTCRFTTLLFVLHITSQTCLVIESLSQHPYFLHMVQDTKSLLTT